MAWTGLVRILEIEHRNKMGELLWKDNNLRNVLHVQGESFLLNALFVGGSNPSTVIPSFYYFGLDARSTVSDTDQMADLVNEPNSNGYQRQSVSSQGVFTVASFSGVYQANSPIIQFTGSGGSWGPVTNLFLATTLNTSGILVASVPLTQSLTVNDGEVVSMRMGLSLKDVSA